MQTQQQLNYERIASAIRFIKENRREQPKLEEMAKHVHMSPYHFQRTFQEYCHQKVEANKKHGDTEVVRLRISAFLFILTYQSIADAPDAINHLRSLPD